MLNRIDRYISGLFWGYFLGSLAVFVTIFVALDAMTTMVSYDKVAASVMLHYYFYFVPEVVYQMIPVATLMGTVFTLSTLNKSNELVALYSVGTSLFRIAMPVMVWVVFLSGLNLFLSDRVLPNFNKQKNYIFYHEIKRNPSMYSIVKNERIWYRAKDKIFNIKTLNEKNNRAQGLSLYYFNDAWDLIQMITAQEVELGEDRWTLFKGSVTIFSEDSSFPQTSDFQSKVIPMDRDTKDITSSGNTSQTLSLSQLANFIKTNKEAGLDTVRYEVDYHSKFGFALAAFVMSLLGIPFSVTKARSGGVMMNVGICLGLVFLYWIFYSSALTLGNYRQIPPVVAAWTPNFMTACLAIYFIRKK